MASCDQIVTNSSSFQLTRASWEGVIMGRTMKLRSLGLLVAFAFGLLAAPLAADAQQAGKVYRIGYFQTARRAQAEHLLKAVEEGLRERGYVVGRDIVIEYRFADGKAERLPDLAAELVRLKVDVIVAVGGAATQAAQQIAELAAKRRLPSIYGQREYAEAGGLMVYSSNPLDLERRAAIYVDKILTGAKPGDLPVEQPTKFELVINLKTAKALGLRIPQSM